MHLDHLLCHAFSPLTFLLCTSRHFRQPTLLCFTVMTVVRIVWLTLLFVRLTSHISLPSTDWSPCPTAWPAPRLSSLLHPHACHIWKETAQSASVRFFFLSCLYKTQQHLGYHSQVHLLNCQFVRFIGDFVVWVICIAREADPIVSQSVGKQSVKRSAAATQWRRVPTQATQEDSPLVDVLSRPCRCFLHSSCARLSHRLVNPQCLSHVATEVFTAEDKTQCGCIFDGHARALALIGHHLFGASLVSNPSNDSRTATKNREEQKGKEGRERTHRMCSIPHQTSNPLLPIFIRLMNPKPPRSNIRRESKMSLQILIQIRKRPQQVFHAIISIIPVLSREVAFFAREETVVGE